MTNNQKSLILGLIIVSVLIFAASVIWYISKNRKTPKKRKKAGVSTALVFSGCLILAIWCLRFAIGYFAIVVPKAGTPTLTVCEEIINGIFKALRTFSLEEEYTEYILNIKELTSAIIPADAWYFSRCQAVFVAYASLLNLIAPVVGGAIILEILASVFPMIKLRLGYIAFWRKKHYFSELNAASLTLAKSIFNESGRRKKPFLIFTDTYVDDEKEKEYGLFLEAKQYGAICVRDDLLHVPKPIAGKREYYLIDENEFGNLQTLMGLINDNNVRYLKEANIYLFVQSDAYVQIEKEINRELEEKGKLFKNGKKPTIIPVNGYRNLVNNLFVDIPLFEPLIAKNFNQNEVNNSEELKKMNLTILGNGAIGTEAFLSAYWFGQMLISKEGDCKPSQCEMTINVVSKDSEDVFWSKIDYINPEIKETICVLGKETDTNESKLLECDNNGTRNSPYCRVSYTRADVKIGGFWDAAVEESQRLLDSDYIIVALGNDADNISVAEKLRCLIGKKHLEEKEGCDVKNTIIAYVVFNSDLANTLNKQRYYQCRDKNKTDIFMCAFGSLEQVYSCDNVYMSKSKLWAEETGAAYDKIRRSCSLVEDNQARNNSENDNYNYWANLARAMHVKYKVFSLGWIKDSVFSCLDENGFNKHHEKIQKQCGEYKKIAVSYGACAFEGDSKSKYFDLESKKHCLAWLEHRRWCAFTRTMGFQNTDAENNIKRFESHKNMTLKLHSCLVEARCPLTNVDGKYILANFGDNTLADKNPDHHDRLDSVSFARKSKNPDECDFKVSDYYHYEFGEYLFLKDLLNELIILDVDHPKKYCKKNKYDKSEVIFSDTNEEKISMISVEAVKRLLQKKYIMCKRKERYSFEFHNSYFATRIDILKDRITNLKKEVITVYKPNPVDTSSVELPEELLELTEKIAENVHENWSVGRIADGWTYGKTRNDELKTTPCLVPYSELSDSEKEYDRSTAIQTLKLIVSLGYKIEKSDEPKSDLRKEK